MPRFYWFTFIFSTLLGACLYHGFREGLTLYHVLFIMVLLILIYLNEKKSVFEDMLGLRARKVLGVVTILIVTLMLIYTLLKGWFA